MFIVALLVAISYAQTAAAGGASSGGQGNGMPQIDPMMYGMYDEVMDLGDMYPEIGDLYDNFYPFMQNMGFGGSSGSGDATGAGGLAGMMGSMPFMGGDLSDMMSDVVDNMKDGDIADVMQNLLPMSQMGLPGLDMNSIMSNGMPNLNGIVQGLAPYLAMDGDFYGDLGDLYNFGSDLFEDYFMYGGMGGGMPDMSSIMGMMGGMGESPMLRKARAARLHKKLRRRRPSRLLKKTRTSRKLRKPREFPWMAFTQPQQQQSGSGKSSTWPSFMGFDAPDSEDIQNFLMMGGNRNSIPPPLDGIDMEDMWMYRGTKWDPMRMFNNIAGQASGSDSTTQSNGPSANNLWLYSWLSGLQKAHMQRKH